MNLRSLLPDVSIGRDTSGYLRLSRDGVEAAAEAFFLLRMLQAPPVVESP